MQIPFFFACSVFLAGRRKEVMPSTVNQSLHCTDSWLGRACLSSDFFFFYIILITSHSAAWLAWACTQRGVSVSAELIQAAPFSFAGIQPQEITKNRFLKFILTACWLIKTEVL